MQPELKWWVELAVPVLLPVCALGLVAFLLRREQRIGDQFAEIQAERQAFWDDADRFAMVDHARDEDASVASLDRIWELEGPER